MIGIAGRLLLREKKDYNLKAKESLIITKYQPILNETVCSVPLIIYPEELKTKKPKVKIRSMNDAPSRGNNQYYERS